MLFTHRDERILDEAARRATEYAKADQHNQARKLRRVTRLQVVKTDSQLERRIEVLFSWACILGIYAVLWMVSKGWIF